MFAAVDCLPVVPVNVAVGATRIASDGTPSGAVHTLPLNVDVSCNRIVLSFQLFVASTANPPVPLTTALSVSSTVSSTSSPGCDVPPDASVVTAAVPEMIGSRARLRPGQRELPALGKVEAGRHTAAQPLATRRTSLQ